MIDCTSLATRPDKQTVAGLLRDHAGRAAVRALDGRNYSAATDDLARRPIVRQAAAILAARAERVAARKDAEEARNVQTGRMVRRLEEIQARRVAALHRQISAAVESAADGLYRISGSKWAGGNHTTTVHVGRVGAAGDSSRAWSSNGKWSGNDSIHIFQVRSTWLDDVAFRGLQIAGGKLVLDLQPVESQDGHEVFRAAWVEQGRGFALNCVHGYLVRHGDVIAMRPTLQAALSAAVKEYRAVLAR